MKKLFIISTLIVSVFFLSCNSRSADKIKAEIESRNELCPIDYNGVGAFTHFECDTDNEIVKVDFTVNDDLMSEDGLGAFKEDELVKGCVDIVNNTSTYINLADEGYDVELQMKEGSSKSKWQHTYTADYMKSIASDFDFQIGLNHSFTQLVAFNYANNVLAKELPKEVGPWNVYKISTEYDMIDIYYKCTLEQADDPSFFMIFTVDGEDDQKMLGGGEHLELTRIEMENALRAGKTVRVGGEPLFGLDFLRKCDVPARYNFEPFCSLTFDNHEIYQP